MKQDKFYFPLTDELDKFIGLIGSQDGIVLPLLSENGGRFHITAYIKQIEQNYLIDIHVKDEKTNKYFSVFRCTLSKEKIADFEKKCENMAIEFMPILSKYIINLNNIDIENLHCLDCSFSNKQFPERFSNAKDFWETLSQIQEQEILGHKNCTNPKHRTFYDIENQRLLHKVDVSVYLYDPSNKMVEELGEIYQKYFSEEMKIFENIINEITKIVNNEQEKLIA